MASWTICFGAGQPLVLDDGSDIPADLRVAYRMLKNAGMVPPEVELRRDVASAEQLVAMASTPEDRAAAYRRWRLLETRLAVTSGSRGNLELENKYFERVLDKLDKTQSSAAGPDCHERITQSRSLMNPS